MTIPVTDAMINIVSRGFGVWNRARIRTTLEQVFALVPEPDHAVDLPVTARLHLQIDQEHLEGEVIAALERAAQGLPTLADWSRSAVATYEVPLTASGAQPVTGQLATQGGAIPPTLAGVSELAEHFGVARSTVAGWIKARADNGMPEPLAKLQAGPVYDLEAVARWHAAWKSTPEAA